MRDAIGMNLLIGTFTIGFILSLLALGRLHQLPDIRVSGYHRGWIDHPRRGGSRDTDGARHQSAAGLAGWLRCRDARRSLHRHYCIPGSRSIRCFQEFW